ncbi:MafI family immunity protein [Samsonia erythrinae]|uniref:MafI family immunity protein n=1 Tax=Samsonia erythrinae TaxID=160434 RepID=A0A4R3VE70_9GAMM|nr:MafI family immunity protein [Samsonia erythrinae]TCV02223.1 hypothetical protein EDC54_11837 [Samsonia erythrinae]
MKADYQEIELVFSNLMKSLDGFFVPEELLEIKEFIDYGEYGLALETTIDIVFEERKLITNDSFNLIMKLSSLMHIDKNITSDRLKEFII